jgi:succinate dehydrogenase/fumarate reductase-like Fe-S protein
MAEKKPTGAEQGSPPAELVPIFVMGRKYDVPYGSTIIGAMEYAGYQLKRGVGCREGFCGACGTVYRLPGDYKLRTGLACQTVVEPGMYLAQIPFTPAAKAVYDMEAVPASVAAFQEYYPEVFRCVSCNTCSKSCPQDLEVMDYVNAIIRGDIEAAANLSFDCIRCGLCGMRCPAEITQYNAGILARRIYGKYLAPRSPELKKRIQEVEKDKYADGLSELMTMDKDKLKERYFARDREPD